MTSEAPPLRVRDLVRSSAWGAGQPYLEGRIVRIDRKHGEAEIHVKDSDPPVIRRRSLRNLERI